MQLQNTQNASTLAQTKAKSWPAEVLLWVLGVMFVSLLAQLTIRLPWTPVPITGQTFGVAVMALTFGRNRALAVMATYLLLGGLGAPIFSAGSFGLNLAPTVGYLIGMFFSSLVVGELANRGATKTWGYAFLAAVCGSVVTFTFGLIVLSHFIPHMSALITAGVLPFLPGDFLKNALAATIATNANRLLK